MIWFKIRLNFIHFFTNFFFDLHLLCNKNIPTGGILETLTKIEAALRKEFKSKSMKSFSLIKSIKWEESIANAWLD